MVKLLDSVTIFLTLWLHCIRIICKTNLSHIFLPKAVGKARAQGHLCIFTFNV